MVPGAEETKSAGAPVTTEEVVLTHIFTIDGVPADLAGQNPTEHFELGRFLLNMDQLAESMVITVLPVNGDAIEVRTGRRVLGTHQLSIELWHDRSGLGQICVQHRVSSDLAELIAHLQSFCHERDTLSLDGRYFVDWVADKVGVGKLALRQDVLQFVEFPESAVNRLVSDGEISDEAVCLVYRTVPDQGWRERGAVRVPRELNRDERTFTAQGRGVVVTCGQASAELAAIRLTASEQLFAIARARRSRATLQRELRAARIRDEQLYANLPLLESLHKTVRDERLALALDVRAFADGLFVPEMVTDAFRRSFSEALRLPEVTVSSMALLDTLAEVVESYLERATLESRKRAESRQLRWQLIVGMASGLAIPIALILTYFGINSQVQVPHDTSIFDVREHAAPWLLTVATGVLILVLATWQYRRSTKGGV